MPSSACTNSKGQDDPLKWTQRSGDGWPASGTHHHRVPIRHIVALLSVQVRQNQGHQIRRLGPASHPLASRRSSARILPSQPDRCDPSPHQRPRPPTPSMAGVQQMTPARDQTDHTVRFVHLCSPTRSPGRSHIIKLCATTPRAPEAHPPLLPAAMGCRSQTDWTGCGLQIRCPPRGWRHRPPRPRFRR